MCQIRVCNVLITTLYIVWIAIGGSGLSHGSLIDNKVLNVGEELWRETLPLRMGSRLYRLQGIKPDTWYEVKISYPASIPASFSIQLKRGDLELPLNGNRRLLNTEKLIFKSENDQGGMYVLVSVEPEGVVAIPNVQEREYIIFNIVCDELLLGIPHQAWWVVGFVVVCLVLAFIIPSFLPPFLLRALDQNASKDS
ncbi:uncharacterized protein LOC133740040 [Rosa rugosa]|uniref:uncharacterized protein LOC133740040 n=1 Tax=Rosa rugosa TaxID=74645 RepID=UPI002B40F76C|nr:uncharacterized protein LOC133740040 [Rosa rugosa]